MTAIARRHATYEDLVRVPANLIAQLIHGVLHTHPRPTLRHAATSSHLGVLLGAPFRFGNGGPGGWILYDEPELHLGPRPDILVPDLAGWRRERLADERPDAPWTAIAPDWICEVLSPSTEALDRAEKMDIYLRERVAHVWLIDPQIRTLEVYRHGGAHWHRLAVHHDDARVRAEPFDAIDLPLGVLWER